MNLLKKSEMHLFRRVLAVLLTTLLTLNPISPIFTPKEVNAQENADAKFLSGVDMSSASVTTSWSDADKYSTDFYNEINNKYNSGYGSNSNALEIDTAGKLAAFAKAVNEGKSFENKYVKLTADINLKGTDLTVEKTDDGTDSNGNAKFKVTISGAADNVWVPIGTYDNPFRGNFDGGTYEVQNMIVLVNQTSEKGTRVGLFGYTSACTIQNTGVSGSVYACDSCAVSAGGLVGASSDSSTISNSYATGSVYSSSAGNVCSFTGGLVGENSGSSTISNSYATSSVYISSYCAYGGGLAGDNEGSINNSYATGSVYSSSAGSYGYSYTGGLAGCNMNSINNSYATGAIYSSASEEDYAGGLVGETSPSSSISHSYATGSVYACASYYVYAGGLVGENYSGSSTISNSYATGSVYSSSAGTVYAGGLIGYNNGGTISDSYYNSEATIEGVKTPTDLGTGLTREQMTGIGISRSTNYMSDLATDNWIFTEDKGAIRYFPRLKAITYGELNPAPYYEIGLTADDFDFTPPSDLIYDGTKKEATVEPKDGITGMGEITINYYDSSLNKLLSAPIDAGTYIVKIDVAKGDNYNAKKDITADEWTFTIEKAEPTISSTATSATYTPGLMLKDVPFPETAEGDTAGTWEWSEPDTPINAAGTYNFKAKFTPTDTFYNPVETYIEVIIGKDDLLAKNFTFTPPEGGNAIYTGYGKSASVTPNGITGVGDVTVYYQTTKESPAGEVVLGEPTTTPPTDVGKYVVSIDVTEDINYNQAEKLSSEDWTFEIMPATPKDPGTPTAIPIIYGYKLSTSTLTVPGWKWVEPDIIPTVTNTGYVAYYSIEGTVGKYDWDTVAKEGGYKIKNATTGGLPARLEKTIPLTVSPATPSCEKPTDLKATYGQTLNNIALTTGWSWVNPDESVGEAGSHRFEAIFTQFKEGSNTEADDNYKTVNEMLDVEVKKADPKYLLPESITATYGQKLSELELPKQTEGEDFTPGYFKWVSEDAYVGDATTDGIEFYVKFVPYDTKNYEESQQETLKVIVNPKSITGDDITISGIAEKYEYNGEDSIQPEVTVTDNGTTLTKDEDYTVSYSSSSDSWEVVGGKIYGKVEISGKENYTGTVTKKFEILDKVLPTGSIYLDENDDVIFSEFNSNIKFGYMFNENKHVKIEGSDSETGIKSIHYYISDEDLFNEKETYTDDEIESTISSKGWKEYNKSESIELKKGTKSIIYAKITDNSGNVKYISSQGIIVYDKVDANLSETYTKSSENDIEIISDLKGNTLKEVKLGSDTLEDTKYAINNNKVSLNGSYLESLSAGDYTFTVSYNPMGEEFIVDSTKGNEPEDIDIVVKVQRATLSEDDFNYESPIDLIYNEKAKEAKVTVKEGITGVGEITVKYYDSEGTLLENPPTDVGEYTVKIDVAPSDKYNKIEDITSDDWKFTVSYLSIEEAQPYEITGHVFVNGNNYWLKDEALATIKPAQNLSGYMISTDLKGPYNSKLEISSWESGTSIYLKDSRGHMTGEIPVNVNITQDKKSPEGSITLENLSTWKDFVNLITFGLFFKNEQTATITATDNESGIKEAKYLVSNSDLIQKENATAEEIVTILDGQTGWVTFAGSSKDVVLEKDNKYVVYEKITDNVGHVTYVSSDGIVIYTDSKTDVDEIEYVKETQNNLKLKIYTNGNTVKGIEIKDADAEDNKYTVGYTISEENKNESTITFNWEDLNKLKYGNYTLTITYNPLGFEYKNNGDSPNDSVVTLSVVKNPKVTVDKFNYESPASLIYDGKPKEAKVTVKEGITGVGKITVKYYDSIGTLLENPPTDVGEYTVKIDVDEGDSYGKASNLTGEGWGFTIKQALPENPVTPTLESVKYGTKLSEITLDEGWNWVDDTIISTIENQGYAAYYAVEDDTNYDWSKVDGYNPELHRVERTLNLTVFVDKSGWGEEVKNNGEINYVDKDGTTSAEIVKKDMTWLKEESDGTSAWYGIDNSEGIFESGSRFWVRWLSKEEYPEEWEHYYNNLDENHKNAVDSGRLWIFLVGITAPNGQEYKEFNKEVPFYIQLGEDWDKDDINAVFISREADEVIDVEYVDDMEYPDGNGEFAKLTLKHFSPYSVYDYLENQESMPDVVESNVNLGDEINIEDNDLPVLFRWLVTGDTNTLIILTGLAVLVISSGVLIALLKKKREN